MKYFILTYNGTPLGESGEDKENGNNQYDLSTACNVCGTGAKLIGNLRTKAIKNVKKQLFTTLDDDIIISNELYDYLKENKAKIGDLKSVVDSKGRQLPYFQFKTDFYFPKTNEIKGLKLEGQCPYCKRNGFFTDAIIGNLENNIPTQIPSLELYYKNINADILNQSDIFNTWEHMGLSNIKAEGKKIVRYARPLLIVSERIKTMLEKNKIKNLQFESIYLD